LRYSKYPMKKLRKVECPGWLKCWTWPEASLPLEVENQAECFAPWTNHFLQLRLLNEKFPKARFDLTENVSHYSGTKSPRQPNRGGRSMAGLEKLLNSSKNLKQKIKILHFFCNLELPYTCLLILFIE